MTGRTRPLRGSLLHLLAMRGSTVAAPRGESRISPTVLILCLAAVIACGESQAQVVFGAPVVTSYGPFALERFRAAGDLDEDGLEDLVLVFGESIAVLSSDGKGAFTQRSRLDGILTFDPRALVLGDWNGDGHLDAVVARSSTNMDPYPGRLTVLAGGGAGDLSLVGHEETVDDPGGLLVADFDENGHLDIAVGSRSPGFSIGLLLGTGTGDFVPAPGLDPGVALTPAILRGGDLDEDGHSDILGVSPSTGSLRVFSGDGAGGFFPGFEIGGIPDLVDARIGDLDEDGHADLVLFLADRVALLSGDGAGAFSVTTVVPSTNRLHSGWILDQDLDGHLDAIGISRVSDFGFDRGRYPGLLLRGDGQGGLTPVGTFYLGRHGPRGPGTTVPGDFDGDGFPDLASGDAVTLNDGRGGMLSAIHVIALEDEGVILRPADGARPAVVDLDLDGRLDLVLAGRIYVRDPSGGFLRAADVEFVGVVRSLVAATLDGGSFPDLAAAHGRDLGLAFGDGTGGFTAPVLHPLAGGTVYSHLHAADLDGSGTVDLAVGMEPDAGAGGTVQILLGDGLGGFLTAPELVTGALPEDIVSGDLDEDGNLDLVVSSKNPAIAEVWRGDGTGGFALALSIQTGLAAGGGTPWLAVAHVDGDPYLDLVVSGGGEVSLLLGDGAGGLGSETLVAVPGELGPTHLADVTADGHVDLARGSTFRIGRGDGTFAAHPFRFFPDVGVIADFTFDGLPDLLGLERSTVYVAENLVLDPIRLRRGNVNGAAGKVQDVLFVNGSAGNGVARRIHLSGGEPTTLYLDRPPSRARARYVIYKTLTEPSLAEATAFPLGVGPLGLVPPVREGAPDCIANTAGHPQLAGIESWPVPTFPAPTELLVLPAGFPATVYLQGIIQDRDSFEGRGAITNGVTVIVE